eukprot:4330272-Amphidinium_carterae.1
MNTVFVLPTKCVVRVLHLRHRGNGAWCHTLDHEDANAVSNTTTDFLTARNLKHIPANCCRSSKQVTPLMRSPRVARSMSVASRFAQEASYEIA